MNKIVIGFITLFMIFGGLIAKSQDSVVYEFKVPKIDEWQMNPFESSLKSE